MSLTDLEYNRYVKSQFRNILSDFDGLVRGAISNKKVYDQGQKVISELFKYYQKLEGHCLKSQSLCNDSFQTVLKTSIQLERVLYQFGLDELEKKHCAKASATDCIKFTEIFSNLESENARLKDQSYAILQKKNQIKKRKEQIKLVRQMMFKTNYYWEEYVMASLGERYRNDYREIFFSFIHPIHTLIHAPDQKKSKFISKINQLNSALNRFYRNLSKDNLKASPHERRTVGVIHRRWNSILKLVLR